MRGPRARRWDWFAVPGGDPFLSNESAIGLDHTLPDVCRREFDDNRLAYLALATPPGTLPKVDIQEEANR